MYVTLQRPPVSVNRGFGRFVPAVAPRKIALRRGVGGIRGLGLSCPAGQVATNQYDGSVKCCGVPGTPAAADPCSFLNSDAFLGAQATDVGPLNSNGVPISAGNGAGAAALAEIVGYPQEVQNAALECWTNPGTTYTDAFGKRITCPSGGTQNLSGGYTSIYTPGQLAAMLASSVAPAPNNTGGGDGGAAGSPGGGSFGPPAQSSYPLGVRLVNSSSGSNSSFSVGDSWTITVTGPPNSPVSVSASQNGASLGSANKGVIGANGQLVITGSMSAAEVGAWVENWTVGGAGAGILSFSVSPAGSGGSPSGGAGGGITSGGAGAGAGGTQISSLLSAPVTVGGLTVPTWGIAAAALAALWFVGGRR